MKKAESSVIAAIFFLLSCTACNTSNSSGSSDEFNSSGQLSTVSDLSSVSSADSSDSKEDDSPEIIINENSVVPIGNELNFNWFTGKAWAKFYRTDSTLKLPTYSIVTFDAGARNDWHSHAGGQILIATGGEGYYQEEGKPVWLMREGDIVEVPPNVKHWHGAAPESRFAHIAIETNSDMGGSSMFNAVSEEEYINIKAEELNPDYSFPIGGLVAGTKISGTVWKKEIVVDKLYNTPDMDYITLASNSEIVVSNKVYALITSGSGLYNGADTAAGNFLYFSGENENSLKAKPDSVLSILFIYV